MECNTRLVSDGGSMVLGIFRIIQESFPFVGRYLHACVVWEFGFAYGHGRLVRTRNLRKTPHPPLVLSADHVCWK